MVLTQPHLMADRDAALELIVNWLSQVVVGLAFH